MSLKFYKSSNSKTNPDIKYFVDELRPQHGHYTRFVVQDNLTLPISHSNKYQHLYYHKGRLLVCMFVTSSPEIHSSDREMDHNIRFSRPQGYFLSYIEVCCSRRVLLIPKMVLGKIYPRHFPPTKIPIRTFVSPPQF